MLSFLTTVFLDWGETIVFEKNRAHDELEPARAGGGAIAKSVLTVLTGL